MRFPASFLLSLIVAWSAMLTSDAGTLAAPAGRLSTTRGDDVMMTPATFDPARIRMKIDAFQVGAAKVGSQCSGSFVVVNTGPGYEKDPDHVLPYWMLTIADGKGAQIYMGGGTWSGPMKTGDRQTLRFDTHSNSVPATQGKPFLFTEPGKYVITMRLYPGRNVGAPVDSRTVSIEVPKGK